MTAATGVKRDIVLKEESAYGEAAGTSGGQLLRRVAVDLNLKKDGYESNEIDASLQTSDMRHGVRRVNGKLDGELSPGSYSPIMAAILKRAFASVTAMTGLSITIAGSGPTYTVTRGSGSFLTDGVKIGDVVRLTAGTFNAANLNKNLFVVGLTATVATVIVLNGSTLTAEGPVAAATVTLPGKKTYVPLTGHTDKSFNLEDYFGDIVQSELYGGIKFNSAQFQLPPTGLATCSFGFVGKDLIETDDAGRYFTSPTAASTTGLTAAVNGVLRINGVTMASVTGMSFQIDPEFTGDPVVGSNTVPNQFPGRVRASGQFTAYFEDGTLRDAFKDETEITIHCAFTTGNSAAADFIAFTFSRVKLSSADKNDGAGGVVRTYNFTALRNINGGAGTAHENTTMSVQDSQAA
ncbi:MAG TPA: phage tail tube protein [Ramlibacter sp.]|nr:phage tail tube protein [Ramlibacter sp.]